MLISLFDLAVMYVRGQHILHLHIFLEITLPLDLPQNRNTHKHFTFISRLYIIHRTSYIKAFA